VNRRVTNRRRRPGHALHLQAIESRYCRILQTIDRKNERIDSIHSSLRQGGQVFFDDDGERAYSMAGTEPDPEIVLAQDHSPRWMPQMAVQYSQNLVSGLGNRVAVDEASHRPDHCELARMAGRDTRQRRRQHGGCQEVRPDSEYDDPFGRNLYAADVLHVIRLATAASRHLWT
jgi:hypothetical protein